MSQRVVEPEILDRLPGDDPRAIRSRRDLRRLNAWMHNRAHLINAIRALRQPPRTIVEAGSGDATLMLSLARELKVQRQIQLTSLDMRPVISPATLEAFATLGWEVTVRQTTIHDWLAAPQPSPCDLLLGNLFWHHFTDRQLASFFRAIASIAGAFIACEPRRSLPARIATHLLWMIGCNHVTRHDAQISVRAGFANKELTALWPADAGHATREHPAGWASHLFFAERIAPR